MDFKRWLKIDEMASFSLSPGSHFVVGCNDIKLKQLGIPCVEKEVGGIDMRFEDPGAYPAPFNKLNQGSKFVAKIPNNATFLAYHAGMMPAEVIPAAQAEELTRQGYVNVPELWLVPAEIYDKDFNIIKPAYSDMTGERKKAIYGEVVVTFDFDDTLCYLDGRPEPKMIALVHHHHSQGHECHIVTARNKINEANRSTGFLSVVRIQDFIEEHNLPIKEVHFTAHTPKGPTLRKLGAVRHYDDDFDQLESAKEHGVEGIHPDTI